MELAQAQRVGVPPVGHHQVGEHLGPGRANGLDHGHQHGDGERGRAGHRQAGLRDAWTQAGHRAEEIRLAVCPVNAADEGAAFTAELLGGADPPNAIAAMSDELALGVLRAAARAGLAVPDTLAVTGLDDSDAAAAVWLTTLAQSLRQQEARCARVALGRPAEVPAREEWQVVVRTTTRRPR